MRVATQELQGGIKDNDSKIKIQDHRRANNKSKKSPRTRLKVSRRVHLNDHPLGGDYEFIKSSVENLVPNPSEFEDLSNIRRKCDVPVCDDFTTFSNLLFDADDNFYSTNNESFSDGDVPNEIYSNPLFDEQIISIKIDLHHFNAESDLIESLLNQKISIISSSKINSLLDEFTGELIFLKSISSRIDKADCDPEEEIRLIEKLLIVTLLEEIDLSLTPDDSMPSDIKNDDYDSEGDILFLEEFLSNDSLSFPENDSFHFDIPSSPRPLAKPPNDDGIYFDDEPVIGILTVKVVDDIFELYVLMPRLCPPNPPLLQMRRNLLISYLIGALNLSSFLLKAR
nr:hypothetical protein [Tanacetum cinerariifolium]